MDYKEKLKHFVIKSNEDTASCAEKKACFFRFQSYEDCNSGAEALRSGWIVCVDLSACELQEGQRIKDYMQGVAYSGFARIKEVGNAYIIYFPNDYHIQEFVN